MKSKYNIVCFSLLVCSSAYSAELSVENTEIGDKGIYERTGNRAVLTLGLLGEGGPQCLGDGALKVERTYKGWMQSSPLISDGEAVTCINGKAVVKGVNISDEKISELTDIAYRAFSNNSAHKPVPIIGFGGGTINIQALLDVMENVKAICAESRKHPLSPERQEKIKQLCN